MNEWKRPGRCESAHCLELFDGGEGLLSLRQSDEHHTVICVSREEFAAFVQAVKAGEYDGYVL